MVLLPWMVPARLAIGVDSVCCPFGSSPSCLSHGCSTPSVPPLAAYPGAAFLGFCVAVLELFWNECRPPLWLFGSCF
ncbi:hypothetical protein KFK09_009927 [Dendrobium nobile]|uniref:Uncharacterized protein n=1 Tax=Dendrobium nobile TaxID=94219 RepID=A0A8T3BLE8_DENNO|nr:hypothetical protein KFK09_009927 [Dendrobium nobile]